MTVNSMKLVKVAFVLLVVTLGIIDARQTTRKCLTPDGDDGVCVPIRECPALHTYIEYKEQTIEESEEYVNASATICRSSSPDIKLMIVCCRNDDLQPYNGTNVMALQGANYTLPDLKTCGRSFSDSAYSRIVGGFEVKKGQFPWMTVLGYGDLDHYTLLQWKCGGSLISQAHVLTAAHCIRKDLVKVRAGVTNIYDFENEGDVIAIYTHENYDHPLMIHDIAILKVNWIDKKEFNAFDTPNCGFICLPTQPAMRRNQFVRYYPFVAGWGLTAWKGDRSWDLMGLQIPVVSNARCLNTVKTSIKTQRVVEKTHLCAGYGKTEKDSCTGDSGGPLMIPQLSEEGHTQYFQIGIVSWGHQCAVKGLPGITRVTEYIEWIQSKLNL